MKNTHEVKGSPREVVMQTLKLMRAQLETLKKNDLRGAWSEGDLAGLNKQINASIRAIHRATPRACPRCTGTGNIHQNCVLR